MPAHRGRFFGLAAGRGGARADRPAGDCDQDRRGRWADLFADAASIDFDDGFDAFAGDAAGDDGIHPDHHRALDLAPSARDGDDSIQSGADGTRPVHDFLRHESDARSGLFDRNQAIRGRTTRRRHRDRPDASSAEEIHARPNSRERPAVVLETVRKTAVRDARRCSIDGADPDLHDQRVENRFSNRIHDLYPVPRHRSRRCQRIDVDGHDDALADADIAAVQDHAVRVGRRLDVALGHARGELSPMTPDSVMDLARHSLLVTAMIAAPLLVVSLIVGLVIGMLQAATQIHEATLSFIPKLLLLVLTLFVAGSWMLRMLTDFTHDLYANIPAMIG